MHVCEEDLELYLKGNLAENQASSVKSHLANCPGCKGNLLESETFMDQLAHLSHRQRMNDGTDRRQDSPRYVSDDAALMTQLNPPRKGRHEIRVLNVSKGGLKLQVPGPLEIGTIVQIRMTQPIHSKHYVISAEVRYCMAVDYTFHAGVQIQDVFPN